MRLREVDVRFAEGVDRRGVVSLGDALSGVLADVGTAELVSLSVSGTDLATFAFAAVPEPGPVPLRLPTSGPTGTPANTSWPAAEAADPAPDVEDCRQALLAAAQLTGAGPVEFVAERDTAVAPLADPEPDGSQP